MNIELTLSIAAFGAAALNTLLVLALARQLGVLLIRVGPSRPMVANEGLDVGTVFPPSSATTITGEAVELRPTKSRSRMLCFISSTCSVCDELVKALPTFARAYRNRIDVVIISKQHPPDGDRRYAVVVGQGIPWIADESLFMVANVLGLPFSLLLDENNVVLARGGATNLDELESLVNVEIFSTREHRRHAEKIGQQHRLAEDAIEATP